MVGDESNNSYCFSFSITDKNNFVYLLPLEKSHKKLQKMINILKTNSTFENKNLRPCFTQLGSIWITGVNLIGQCSIFIDLYSWGK